VKGALLLSAFLVEDEALILMMTSDMVEELGHQVVARASSIDKAAIFAETADFDLAILDVNIAGQSIAPIAMTIAKRGIPLVFATGYAAGVLPDGFGDRPYLRKPYLISQLRLAIRLATTSP
jgi:CheY-like chemotaxis protein